MITRPLFYAVSFFAAGIWVGRYVLLPIEALVAIITLFAIAIIYTYIAHRDKWRIPLAMLLFFGLGILRIAPLVSPQLPANHLSFWIDKGQQTIEGKVVSAPVNYPDGHASVALDSQKVYLNPNEWTTTNGKIQIYISKNAPLVGQGDLVVLRSDVRPIFDYRTPGSRNRSWHMATKKIYLTGYVRTGDRIQVIDRSTPTIARIIENVRRSIRQAALGAKRQGGSMVLALVLGDSQYLDRHITDSFRTVGLSHLLAISGLHISAIAGMVFLLLWFTASHLGNLALHCRVHRLAAIITFPIPIAYAVLAGGTISVVRACLMYLLLLLSFVIGRRRDPYIAVAIAAAFILVFDPGSLWNIGFQFSFSAVLGMIYLRGTISSLSRQSSMSEKLLAAGWSRRLRPQLIRIIGFSAAAFLATAPFTAWHFGVVAPASLIANLAAIPIFSLFVVPLLLAGTCGLVISSSLAHFCWQIAYFAVQQVQGMALLLQDMGLGQLISGRPTLLELLAFLAIFLSLPHLKKPIVRYVAIVGLAVLLLSPAALSMHRRWQKHLQVTMLDVQQGLSVLVEMPGGKNLLFDCGGRAFSRFDVGGAVVLPFLSSKRLRRVDVVVASHPHPDHYKGLAAVLDNLTIGEIWAIKPQHDFAYAAPYFFLLDKARRKGILVKELNTATEPVMWGNTRIAIINPPPSVPANWNINNQSLALRIEHRGESVLLCADMEREAERNVLASGFNLRADLVQVGHHGSQTSSTKPFVQAVSPRHALVPVGLYNHWHHPSADVLERWHSHGASIWRTDLQGAIYCRIVDSDWQCGLLSGRISNPILR